MTAPTYKQVSSPLQLLAQLFAEPRILLACLALLQQFQADTLQAVGAKAE